MHHTTKDAIQAIIETPSIILNAIILDGHTTRLNSFLTDELSIHRLCPQAVYRKQLMERIRQKIDAKAQIGCSEERY